MLKTQRFTPKAQPLWDAIPTEVQDKILHNVFCSHCGHMTTMANFSGRVEQGDLILRGACFACGHAVARLIETGE